MHYYLKSLAHLVFTWKNSVKEPIWAGWNHTSDKYGLFAVKIGFKLAPSVWIFLLYENVAYFKEQMSCSI